MKRAISVKRANSVKHAISLKLLVSAGVVTFAATVSPGCAADAGAFGHRITVAEFQGSFAPNRLDVYDYRRELARDAEHRRIRTRLGDPGCQTIAADNRYDDRGLRPALVVVTCR